MTQNRKNRDSSTTLATNLKNVFLRYEKTLILALILIVVSLFLFKIFLGYLVFPGDILFQWKPWSLGNPNVLKKILPIHNPLLGDAVTAFYPWRYFMKKTVQQGIFPLWNPYVMAGTPFFANWQSGVLDPLNSFFYLTSLEKAINIGIFLKLSLAGFFMFLFMRIRAVKITGSLFSAFAYMFSGFYVVWLNWPHTSAAIWTPVILYIVEKILAEEFFRNSLWLSLCIGFLFLAGHPGTLIQSMMIALVYGSVRLTQQRAKRRTYRKNLVFIATGVILGIMVASILLIPGIEFMRESFQWTNRTSKVYGRGSSLPVQALALLFFPNFFGNLKDGTWLSGAPANYNEISMYVGILTLLFAFLAVFHRKSFRKSIPFVITAAFSFFLIFGLGPHNFLASLPVVSMQPAPRYIFMLTFSLAVLGGIGVDIFLSDDLRKFSEYSLVMLIILLSVTLGLIIFRLNPVIREKYSWQFVIIGLSLFLFFLGFSRRIPRASMKILLVLLLLIDLFYFGFDYNSYIRKEQAYPPTKLTRFLKRDSSLHRVLPLSVIMPPNSGIPYDLYDLRGRDALLISRFNDFSTLITDSSIPPQFPNFILPNKFDSKFVDFLNVKYVITEGDIDITLPSNEIRNNTIVGEIKGDHQEGQTFKATQDELTQIDVLMATYARKNTKSLIFRLAERRGEDFKEIRTLTVSAADIKDNRYFGFRFPPVPLSKGKKYYFFIESPNSTRLDSVTLYANTANKYLQGTRMKNGQIHPGDLSFRLRYKAKVEGFEQVYKEDGLRVYQNLDFSPRAYLVRDYLVVRESKNVLKALQRKNFDPATEVILEEKPAFVRGVKSQAEVEKEKVVIEEYQPGEVEVKVNSKKDGILVLSDTFYPGWKAYVDGEESKIYRANYVFRALPLKKGVHKVKLEYRPSSFQVGKTISFATFLFVFAGLLLGYRQELKMFIRKRE